MPDYAPVAVGIALLVALFWPTLHFWAFEYRPDEYYAHGPIVPFLIGFLIWTDRRRIAAIPVRACYPALAGLIPSLALQVYAVKMGLLAIMSYSLVLSIWFTVLLLVGSALTRRLVFPLAFILLMVPLPGPMLNDLTLHLQDLSTVGASHLLSMLTYTNTCSGNIIQMENYKFFVDVPCSGFKTVLALLTFNAFFAKLVDGGTWRRIVLFLISVPLALAINTARIALIGFVGESFSDQAAHVFHDYSGMITLVLGFCALFALAKVLGCRRFAEWELF